MGCYTRSGSSFEVLPRRDFPPRAFLFSTNPIVLAMNQMKDIKTGFGNSRPEQRVLFGFFALRRLISENLLFLFGLTFYLLMAGGGIVFGNDMSMSSHAPLPIAPNGAAASIAPETTIDSTSSSSGIPQRYAVASHYFNWYDVNRRKTLPFKMYYPLQPQAACPVVIFSHGLGGSREDCAYLGTDWAAQGIVSIHLHHPGSDSSLWQRRLLRSLNEMKSAYTRTWNGRARAEDIRFILDRLCLLAHENDTLNSLLDLNRVGLAGCNIGALGALLLAGQTPPDGRSSLRDPRIKAVIALSPPVHAPRISYVADYAGIAIPCLFITGTEDNSLVGETRAADRRIPFDSITRNEQFLLTLRGGDHMVYAGHRRASRATNDGIYQREIGRIAAVFWAAYLQDDPDSRMRLVSLPYGPVSTSIAHFERKMIPNPMQTSSERTSTPAPASF